MDDEYVETIMKQHGISWVLDGMESDTDSITSYTLEKYIQDKKFYDSRELIKAQFIGWLKWRGVLKLSNLIRDKITI